MKWTENSVYALRNGPSTAPRAWLLVVAYPVFEQWAVAEKGFDVRTRFALGGKYQSQLFEAGLAMVLSMLLRWVPRSVQKQHCR
jgi:hypothetical protein